MEKTGFSTEKLASLDKCSTESSAAKSRAKWIKLKGLDEEFKMNMFVLTADGAVLCLLCQKYNTVGRGAAKYAYGRDAAYPSRQDLLEKHIETDMHREACDKERNQRCSDLHKLYEDRIKHKAITVAERVHLIYWVMKEEIANRKVSSLQSLIDLIGHNDRLRDMHKTSSTAVSEFIC